MACHVQLLVIDQQSFTPCRSYVPPNYQAGSQERAQGCKGGVVDEHDRAEVRGAGLFSLHPGLTGTQVVKFVLLIFLFGQGRLGIAR